MSFNPYRFWETNPSETYVKSRMAFALHLTGNATIDGRFLVSGTSRFVGAGTIDGNWTMAGTARIGTTTSTCGAIYLGTGTKAIAWCTAGVDAINSGYAAAGGDLDKGSILIGGTANLYWKTDYGVTNWASADASD